MYKVANAKCTILQKSIAGINHNQYPFVWKKREVIGSQIKDKLSNLHA
jgi:hypothetical protein